MTWSWSIPIALEPSRALSCRLLVAERTRVIVPTFRDWDDARRTVESILACRPRAAEIVLVDDNAEGTPPPWVRRLPTLLVRYRGNRGPAFARNAGAQVRTRAPIEWLYFTDGGCERDASFFAELSDASASMPRTTVAIAGPVVGRVISPTVTPVNHYMTAEAILCPPRDGNGPQAIVTANAAVSRVAFDLLRGFRTEFPAAAGEDLDLGMRLRRIGAIGWAPQAVVEHAFAESRLDFFRRFERYGAGNARLARLWGIQSLRAIPFRVEGSLQELADLQVDAMQRGYDGEQIRLGGACVRTLAGSSVGRSTHRS